MTEPIRPRCHVAGLDRAGRPVIVRVDLEAGREPSLLLRAYRDPAVCSGHAGPGRAITSVTPVCARDGGAWLVATVERGRPRLLDPERLGVVALLGRRREWPGATSEVGPFLRLRCDRAPVLVDGAVLGLARTEDGQHSLIRARAGEALERWTLGRLPGRVALLGGARALVLVVAAAGQTRVAVVELAGLVAGGRPLRDAREVGLELAWRPLARDRDWMPVAVLGLLDDGRRVRVLEQAGPRWRVAIVDLDRPARSQALAVPRPRRWLSGGDRAWLTTADGELLALGPDLDDPGSRRAGYTEPDAWVVEHDGRGHPWLWAWRRGELERLDGLDLGLGEHPVQRWSLGLSLRAHALCVGEATAAGDPAEIRPTDELAELLPSQPELAAAWPTWFDRATSSPGFSE